MPTRVRVRSRFRTHLGEVNQEEEEATAATRRRQSVYFTF